MRCAPYVGLTGQLARVPPGTAGIFATVRAMRSLIDAGKVSPVMIEAASQLIYLVPAKAQLSEIDALFSWVQDHVRYQQDVAGVETLADPLTTLRRQAGDCDDQVTLLGTLLEAAGYPTRIVIAAYQAPQAWEHTYLQALADGQWIDLDPTEDGPIGYAPPGAVSLWIEPR